MVGRSGLVTHLLAVDVSSSVLVALARTWRDAGLLHFTWAETPQQALGLGGLQPPDVAVLGSVGRGNDAWASLAQALLISPSITVIALSDDDDAGLPEWAADPRVAVSSPAALPVRISMALARRQDDATADLFGTSTTSPAANAVLNRLCETYIKLPSELDRARNLELVVRSLRAALQAETVSIFVAGSSTRVTDPPQPPLPDSAAPVEAIARETRALITRPVLGANVLLCVPVVASGSELGAISVLAPAEVTTAGAVLISLHVLAGAVAGRLELVQARRAQALALQDMRAVADSARGVAAGLGLDEVLHGILRAATRHIPTASAGVVFLSDGSVPWSAKARTGDPDVVAAVNDSWSSLSSRVESDLSPLLLHGADVAEGIPELAVAPLLVGSAPVGALVLAAHAESGFSERDLRVLGTVADQGALAVENARLQSQAQKADEIAVLYQLGQALNSTLDLQGTIMTALSTARSLAAAVSAELRLIAADGTSLESVVGLGETLDSSPGDRYRMSVLYPQAVLSSRHPLLIPDVRTSSPGDEFSEREPPTWLGAYLGVPLMAGERVIGVLSLSSSRPGAFSAEDLRLLEIVASQAASALSNARLHQETVRSLREAEAIADVSRSVASSLDQRTVLQTVTSALVDSMPLARYSFSYLVGPSGTPSLLALAPPEAESLSELDSGIWQWCADGCLVRGEPVVVDDTLRLGFPSHNVETAHSVMAVPMVATGKTLGVIGVDSMLPNAFTPGDLRLIRTMADQAATAIESATLYRDLERAYQDLRQGSQVLSAVFNGITDGMYIVDRDNSIVAINQPEARFLGLRRETLIGASYTAHYHRSEGKCEHCAVIEALDRGEHTSTIVSYTDRGQVPVWREVDAYPIRDEAGATHEVVVFARDVTERRRIEATLAESSRMASVGQLASSVAHEVNNPLTVIIGNAEVMLLDMTSDDPNRESMEMILRAANRAARTIRNLLDLSSQPEEELSEIDVCGTVEDALELLTHPLRKAGIEVETHLDDDLPPVTASANLLKTVWMSMILNARDAVIAGDRGTRRIVVRSGVSDGGAEVYVSIGDSGVGIRESQREQLFQPFYTTKPLGEALGLGLYGAYSVIREHGGRIEVESPPDSGAIFTVYLPIDRGDLEPMDRRLEV